MTVVPGYGFPPADPGRLLASTADRQRALDVLKAGFAEGRLTKDEHDERMGQVYTARTYADLAMATGDLPGGQQPVTYYPPAAYPPGLPGYPRPVPGYPPAAYPPAVYPPGLPGYPPVHYGPKANSLALASLWCGIAGLVFSATSVPAVIISILAFSQMRRSGEKGSGAATAGLALGCLGIILLVLRVVVAVHGSLSGRSTADNRRQQLTQPYLLPGHRYRARPAPSSSCGLLPARWTARR